ncbi:hypothetical protein Tco_1433857, partial [Tanacetum coccineum]
LQEKVLNLEKAKTAQAKEIANLKKRVKVESSNDASLGAQEDASKQERKITDLDADVEVTLVDETQEMNDDNLMFDIEIKATKPKVVTSAATTTTTIRPKVRGVVVQEPKEFKTTSSSLQASQLPQAKDKGKGIIVEPEVPLKKKDQIAMDEEVARNLKA